MKKFIRHETVLLALLLALLAYAKATDPGFLDGGAQVKLFKSHAELALIAIPMTLIILTGGIDLSVASAAGLCSVMMGIAYSHHLPVAICVVVALATGALAGALNGFFVARVHVHPLLVTLATLAAFRGVATGLSHGEGVTGFTDAFGPVVGGAAPAIAFVAAATMAWLWLSFAPGGAWLRAVGFNETAARFSALPVAQLKARLFTLAGLAAGMAAVLYAARLNTAKPDIAEGLELEAITAVVLGGTSIFGGRGHVLGTVLGLLLIIETREFISWHWQRDELILIALGVLLIFSVLLNKMLGDKS